MVLVVLLLEMEEVEVPEVVVLKVEELELEVLEVEVVEVELDEDVVLVCTPGRHCKAGPAARTLPSRAPFCRETGALRCPWGPGGGRREASLPETTCCPADSGTLASIDSLPTSKGRRNPVRQIAAFFPCLEGHNEETYRNLGSCNMWGTEPSCRSSLVFYEIRARSDIRRRHLSSRPFL